MSESPSPSSSPRLNSDTSLPSSTRSAPFGGLPGALLRTRLEPPALSGCGHHLRAPTLGLLAMIRTLLILLASTLPAQSATTSTYGKGCGGALLFVDLPRLNRQVGCTVTSNNASKAILGIGLAKASTPIGGCTLLIHPVWTLPISMTLGRGGTTLGTIPNNPALIGHRLYLQAVANDNPGPAWTPGTQATIGR